LLRRRLLRNRDRGEVKLHHLFCHPLALVVCVDSLVKHPAPLGF
jgi:hypothetical protein